jgi:hypothetical protein
MIAYAEPLGEFVAPSWQEAWWLPIVQPSERRAQRDHTR